MTPFACFGRSGLPLTNVTEPYAPVQMPSLSAHGADGQENAPEAKCVEMLRTTDGYHPPEHPPHLHCLGMTESEGDRKVGPLSLC